MGIDSEKWSVPNVLSFYYIINISRKFRPEIFSIEWLKKYKVVVGIYLSTEKIRKLFPIRTDYLWPLQLVSTAAVLRWFLA